MKASEQRFQKNCPFQHGKKNAKSGITANIRYYIEKLGILSCFFTSLGKIYNHSWPIRN